MGAVGRRPGGAAGAPLTIARATGDDADALRALFREYGDSIGELFRREEFEEELAALPGGYDAILLARKGEELVGCVAVKRLPDGAAELKRLDVRPSARGVGLGRSLAVAAVAEARALGYSTMRLDTLPTMDAARALYCSLGFVEIERYNDNPLPGVLFFELEL